MLQELQQVFSNPLWTLLIGVAATIVVAVIIYSKSKRIRKPTFLIRSNNLVAGFGKKLDKLQLLYDETNIENLTVSKIAFWNEGAETLEQANVVEAEPLRIEAVGSCDILDAYVIQKNNEANKFSVELVSSKRVKILFDFLEKGEGGVIQLIHTGKESLDIELKGLVKGAGKPRSSYGSNLLTKISKKLFTPPKQKQQPKQSPKRQRRAFGVFSFGYAVFMVIVTITQTDILNQIVGIIFVLILLYFGYYMLKRRVPKGLEIVEEEEL